MDKVVRTVLVNESNASEILFVNGFKNISILRGFDNEEKYPII